MRHPSTILYHQSSCPSLAGDMAGLYSCLRSKPQMSKPPQLLSTHSPIPSRTISCFRLKCRSTLMVQTTQWSSFDYPLPAPQSMGPLMALSNQTTYSNASQFDLSASNPGHLHIKTEQESGGPFCPYRAPTFSTFDVNTPIPSSYNPTWTANTNVQTQPTPSVDTNAAYEFFIQANELIGDLTNAVDYLNTHHSNQQKYAVMASLGQKLARVGGSWQSKYTSLGFPAPTSMANGNPSG